LWRPLPNLPMIAPSIPCGWCRASPH
jgi:hypothetical protein